MRGGRELQVSASTTDYYNRNAGQFIGDTLDVDMGALYQPFLSRLPAGAEILDAGCGSGRDALAFQALGYRVSAFDASEALAAHAAQILGIPVAVRRFDEVDEVDCYAGIWACASLLHVPVSQLPEFFSRLWRALRAGGVFYCSFKYGNSEREVEGRHFTDANEQRIRDWTQELEGLAKTEIWLTADRRPDRDDKWVNVLLSKGVSK
jgi:SAM-dependent methyltransferase